VRAYYVTRRPPFQGVLFGRRVFQNALLRIAREGSVLTPNFDFDIHKSALGSTGIITRSEVTRGQSWSLEPKHPAHAELLATLRALDPDLVVAEIPPPGELRLVRGDAPLAHSLLAAFRVLAALTSGPTTRTRLLEVVEQRPPAVESAIASLVTDGILVVAADAFATPTTSHSSISTSFEKSRQRSPGTPASNTSPSAGR